MSAATVCAAAWLALSLNDTPKVPIKFRVDVIDVITYPTRTDMFGYGCQISTRGGKWYNVAEKCDVVFKMMEDAHRQCTPAKE